MRELQMTGVRISGFFSLVNAKNDLHELHSV